MSSREDVTVSGGAMGVWEVQQDRLARAREVLKTLPGPLQNTIMMPEQAVGGRAGESQRRESVRATVVSGGGRERQLLPLATGMRPLLPDGLPRGAVVAVRGSTSLGLALVGQASREGAWVAMVGMPHVGVIAAARHGLALPRLVLIPQPGMHAPAVIAACLEGMDVVMVGSSLALSEPDRRRLTSRTRVHGAVVVSMEAQGWPGARAEFMVRHMHWSGLGAGDGRLLSREITVVVRDRAVRERTVVVEMDGLDSAWSPPLRAAMPVHEVA